MIYSKMSLYWHRMQDSFVETRKTMQVGLRKMLQINEWTFSLFLFTFSLAIVLGKLFVNYGGALQWSIEGHFGLPSLPAFSQVSNLSSIRNLPRLVRFDKGQLVEASEKLINVSHQYEEALTDAVVKLSNKYGWLMRAALSGMAMMGFTWFIIYKDSSIPGVNPPSPFSPTKHRFPASSRIQMNYLVGVLNGILIFIYMCL